MDADAKYNGDFMFLSGPFGASSMPFIGNTISSFMAEIGEKFTRAMLGDTGVFVAGLKMSDCPGREWASRTRDDAEPRARFYQDDLLVSGKYWFATVAMKAMMEGVVARAGFTFKPSDEVAGTNMVYCGIRINTVAQTFAMTEGARQRLLDKVEHALRCHRNRRGIKVRELLKLAGSFAHYETLMRGGSSHSLPTMQMAGAALHKKLRAVQLSKRIGKDLEFWRSGLVRCARLGCRRCVEAFSVPTRINLDLQDVVLVCTDAAGRGVRQVGQGQDGVVWEDAHQNGGGAVVVDARRRLVFVKRWHWTHQIIRELLRSGGKDSSSLREAEIVRRAGLCLEDELECRSDQVRIVLGDNRSVMAGLARGDSRVEGSLRLQIRRTVAAPKGKCGTAMLPVHVRREHPAIAFTDAIGRDDVVCVSVHGPGSSTSQTWAAATSRRKGRAGYEF
jgi:hypothetical protein